jgi:hypothetical protein
MIAETVCLVSSIGRKYMDDKLQEQRQRAEQEQGEIEETREDLKREQKQTPNAEYAPREEETRDNGDTDEE